ncbi:MAG: leucine-rich repeat protein [Prevotella sp.]|nr:leucine-rich repeat protein [Prevotella sp.]
MIHKLQNLRKSIMMMIIMLPLAAGAQDACYLLGTDGTMEANHASATLTKVSDGVFEGEVTFADTDGTLRFYVATKLAGSADDWVSIDNNVWAADRSNRNIKFDTAVPLSQGYSTRNNYPFRFGERERGTYQVTVDFNNGTILVKNPNPENTDPEVDPDDPEKNTDPEVDPNDPENQNRMPENCYLIGTDGIMEANHASATLEKTGDGVFSGTVTFTNREFTMTTQLASTADGWDEIANKRYAPIDMELPLGEEKWFYEFERSFANFNLSCDDKYLGKPLLVTFKFNSSMKGGDILISVPEETEEILDKESDGTTPAEDIDLTKGAHFTINLAEPNTLKQRLENAVFQTDYDLVDYLTVKGKFGGKDLVYLKEQQGLVSQLQYLDLSNIEMVYDDEPYHTIATHDGGDLPIGIVNYYYSIYTFSAENKEEAGTGGGFTGTSTSTVKYLRRNDFAYAFNGMKYLKQIKLPKSLKGLGSSILRDCEVLEKVTFPDAATYIADGAFVNKTGGFFSVSRRTLQGVDLPETIDSLGVDAMRGVGFRTIDVSRISRMGDGCLAETNVLEVKFHPNLKTIAANAFSYCYRLKSVSIPSTVQNIGEGAFNNCPKLAEVTFAGKLESIGDGAFSGCKKLTTIDINAKMIGKNAFSGCDLTSVVLKDGTKSIGAFAFSSNPKLTSVTAPNTLEEVGSHAFQGSAEYGVGDYDTPFITNLPAEDGVKYIGSVAYIFTGGSNLKIKEGTLGVADDFLSNHNYWYDEQNSGGSSSNFNGWTAPTTVTLPSTLRILGKQCLKNAAITTIELPESLEKIGERAFAADGGSGNLKRVNIPKNVTYIGFEAFKGTPLVRINYNAIDANADGVATWAGGYSPFPESVTRVIIGEGVKKLPNNLFDGCKNIARLEMPSTVESIGDYAFAGCSSLSHIDLPSSLREIGKSAFAGCAFQSVTSYMKEPFVLGGASVQEGEEEKLGWKDENGNITWYESTGSTTVWDPNAGYEWLPYYYVSVSSETPFGDINYYYERGNAEEEATNKKAAVPLLKVPNGTLDTYLADPSWAVTFYTIEQFDGASSADVVKETTTISVSEKVTDDTDLTSTMLGNIFVTLDTEDSGDGYNASEGCLVINSTVSEEALAAATADGADDLTVKNQFNGLIFEVPAGKGKIDIDCQTLGQNMIFVKIGDAAPQQVNANSRKTMTVPYEVSMASRIYVYADKATSNTEARDNRAAYANDDAVKIYGLTVNVDETTDVLPGDANGDGMVNVTDIVEIVNAILGHPSAKFDPVAADVNSDGEVNVTDIVSVVNIILSNPATARELMGEDDEEDY